MDRAVSEGRNQPDPRCLAGHPRVHGITICVLAGWAIWFRVDVHLEIDATLTVAQGHDIAAAAARVTGACRC